MNKDQVAGKIKQAVGKVERSVGEGVGNEKLANKGVVNQTKGAVQETWGNERMSASLWTTRKRRQRSRLRNLKSDTPRESRRVSVRCRITFVRQQEREMAQSGVSITCSSLDPAAPSEEQTTTKAA
jgi:uncharacterized protein YjbJ (UPF0337 family)